jgi:hypothetical protein
MARVPPRVGSSVILDRYGGQLCGIHLEYRGIRAVPPPQRSIYRIWAELSIEIWGEITKIIVSI